MDNEQAWRDGLQAGDEVIIDGEIKTVTRTTRTHVIFKVTPFHEERYRRSDGGKVSAGAYHSRWMRQPTAERRARVDMLARAWAAMAVINKTTFRDLPVEKLERIVAIIQEGTPHGNE